MSFRMPAFEEKEPEIEPIPPPTHIAQTYEEFVTTKVKGERDRDPFGFKIDIPSLKKDSRIQNLMISKNEIAKELQSTILPPEQHQDSKAINAEIEDLSEGVNSFASLLLYRLVFSSDFPPGSSFRNVSWWVGNLDSSDAVKTFLENMNVMNCLFILIRSQIENN